MKKSIVVSLLLMFLLTGCISFNGEVKGTIFDKPLSNPKVHKEDFNIDCQTEYDPDYDEYYMLYRVTNNSEYPVTQYQCFGTINDGQNETQLDFFGTLMPGETSTVQETSDITSLNDMEITQIQYVYKDKNDKDVVVVYDAKLDKYK